MNRPPNSPEDRHFPEPEIIPPERPDRRARPDATWTGVFVTENGIRRISVKKIGPLGLFVFWTVAVAVALALVVLFLGAFLFLIPLAVVLFAVGIGASIWRTISQGRF
jgi:predicted RND superfamily exporter protein